MMRRQTSDQSHWFPLFNLGRAFREVICCGGSIRSVSRLLTGLREKLGPLCREVGRPSIDPGLSSRTLLVVYCYGIQPL